MGSEWIAISERLPDEGVIVFTKIDDERGARNEQPLKRRGRLWFLADDSMYVYYTPTHWTTTPPAQRSETVVACCGHSKRNHGLPGVNTARGYCASCPTDRTWHDYTWHDYVPDTTAPHEAPKGGNDGK
jgi:hypothetical protein